MRRTCPSGHGSDGSGRKWNAPPCSESAAQKESFRPQRRVYNEVLQAIQKKSRPSPSNCVTPFACKLLPEQGFGFRKANVIEFHVFASHFPCDEVQNEAEVRGTRIQTQMAQKPVLREEEEIRVRCAYNSSAE